MKKIILFADTGIDDAIALIYALKHPHLDLMAVVSGFGNTDRDRSARNAAYLLKLAGRTDIPVITGSKRPLSGETPIFFPEIHGAEGLGPISPPASPERFSTRTNFSTLFRLLKQHPGEITIVNVGRCTSLAIAWYLGPDVMKLAKNTYLMGGAFLEPGNVTEVAEANFHGDPIAADFVCQNAPNLTIIPLNATRNALLTPALVDFIDSRAVSPLQQIIKPILDFYYEAYQELEPGIEGTPQHDLSAVMAALEIPGLFSYMRKKVKVEDKDGYATGLSIADFRPGVPPCDGAGCARIATEMDAGVFTTNVLDILTRG
ncbi:nucleoside hydrolase [Rossellomorea aquimaris]|uniref:nucleoside hydrolase n=1 Tax=Rossellomorea aquimaris TaxID=189382 RepID=UPI001CD750E8|nr:nucleoside hydrolase [Rossellomorea aquimaris]MCA1055029.1 nucleoside hydrolase [Rossellomorea aquimaris]